MSISRVCVVLTALLASSAGAAVVQLRVTARNLAPTNSVTFAPLRVGFHDGTFDVFNQGQTATAPIISIAEGGSGADWFPAFASQQPMGVSGTVVNGGPLLPGQSASAVFNVDSALNRYFTFASMVVPSNDHFIGNDSGTAYELFNAQGQFVGGTILQRASDIWEAGSEVNSIPNAAFIVGSNNDARIADTGVVDFDFAGLSLFNGQMTAAGYMFQSQLASDTGVYEITFEVIPAPAATPVLAIAGLMMARRRRSGV